MAVCFPASASRSRPVIAKTRHTLLNSKVVPIAFEQRRCPRSLWVVQDSNLRPNRWKSRSLSPTELTTHICPAGIAPVPKGAASYGLQLIGGPCHEVTLDANQMENHKPRPCWAVTHMRPAGIAPVPEGAASYGLQLIHAQKKGKGDLMTAGGAYRIRTGAISLEG